MSKMNEFAIRILFTIAQMIASDELKREIHGLAVHWNVTPMSKEDRP